MNTIHRAYCVYTTRILLCVYSCDLYAYTCTAYIKTYTPIAKPANLVPPISTCLVYFYYNHKSVLPPPPGFRRRAPAPAHRRRSKLSIGTRHRRNDKIINNNRADYPWACPYARVYCRRVADGRFSCTNRTGRSRKTDTAKCQRISQDE